MKNIQTKKSAVDLTDLAISILVLGIVVSIGANILINFRDSRLTSIDTGTIANESVSATDTGTTLSQTWFKSVTSVVNATGGETILSTGNYSTAVNDFGVGTINFVGTSPYNATNVNVTYNYYDTSSPEYALSNNAAIGLGEYGNWFTIIVIVGVASVILSLIFMAFGGNKGNSSSVSY